MSAHHQALPSSFTTSPDDPVPAAITPADLRRAAWASSLGSALEYYDFAL